MYLFFPWILFSCIDGSLYVWRNEIHLANDIDMRYAYPFLNHSQACRNLSGEITALNLRTFKI
jgi:hypothetical protein